MEIDYSDARSNKIRFQRRFRILFRLKLIAQTNKKRNLFGFVIEEAKV